jgi:hypothetical protein
MGYCDPIAVLYVPDGHLVHAVASAAVLYVPAMHWEHDPAVDDPAGHRDNERREIVSNTRKIRLHAILEGILELFVCLYTGALVWSVCA